MNPLIEIMQSPKYERETISFSFFLFFLEGRKTPKQNKSPHRYEISPLLRGDISNIKYLSLINTFKNQQFGNQIKYQFVLSLATMKLYTTKNSINQIDAAFATDGQATQVAWVLKITTRQSRPPYKRLQ